MSVTVVIDSREVVLKEYVSNIDGIVFTVQQLDVGDVHIVKNDECQLVIERKSISDMMSSISDGRWTEQKWRCLEWCKKVLYIIETGHEVWGRFHSWCDFARHVSNPYQKVTGTGCLTALLNLLVVHGIHFMLVKDTPMTAETIAMLWERYRQPLPPHHQSATVVGDGTATDHQDYQEAFLRSIHTRKKDNMSIGTYYIHCLMGIPSISSKTALKFKELFPSIIDLVAFVREHDKTAFHGLWKTRGFRKLPDKSVDFLFEVFGPVERMHPDQILVA